MNTLRSVLRALSLVAVLPFAAGCALEGTESDTVEETTEAEGNLICTTCDNDTPHDPPKHPDLVVLPGYSARVGSDGLWYVSVTVKNQGTGSGDVGILGVASGVDGQPLGGTASVLTSGTLLAGQTKVIEFALGDHGDPKDPFCDGAYNYPCIGNSLAPYYLKVTADYWAQTFELNETNNTTIINL